MDYPTDPPRPDVLEVSLFGPGVGECVVVQAGSAGWLVVDSCPGGGGRAVALEYLAAIGVAPTSIARVVATHWHDDHLGGLPEVVAAAASARFVCSGAPGRAEFLSLVAAAADVRRTTVLGSGVDAFDAILDELRRRRTRPMWAGPAQCVLQAEHTQVTSLSPSAATLERSLLGLAAFAPQLNAALRRVPDLAPNEACVVLHLRCGEAVVLLGADLEVSSAADRGWHAVVASTERPSTRASVYKVAHHGSATADLPAIWQTLLVPTPLAILSPFTRSRLPTEADVERLRAAAGRVFQTAGGSGPRVRREPAVERTLATAARRPPRPRRGKLGQVRLRLDPSTGAVTSVETFGAAFEVAPAVTRAQGSNHATGRP